MSFYEFIDAILAAAIYTNPNPLICVSLRIENFLEKDFFPGIVEYFTEATRSPRAAVQRQREALVRILSGTQTQEDREQARQEAKARQQRLLAKRDNFGLGSEEEQGAHRPHSAERSGDHQRHERIVTIADIQKSTGLQEVVPLGGTHMSTVHRSARGSALRRQPSF